MWKNPRRPDKEETDNERSPSKIFFKKARTLLDDAEKWDHLNDTVLKDGTIKLLQDHLKAKVQ